MFANFGKEYALNVVLAVVYDLNLVDVNSGRDSDIKCDRFCHIDMSCLNFLLDKS